MVLTLVVFTVLCTSATFARKGFGPTEQEWGFVTVREGAHMFWWLHKTRAQVDDYTQRPLVIWLQGGPGASSTGYGNFAELGPLDENLKPRNTSWINNYNVLFVDNPVGTGFSHVDSVRYFSTTNRQIAEDFIELLKGFYKAVPELKETPLYIFSESYGGKMAAEIALMVDKATKDGILDVELAGVGLGDSWISPIDSVMTWASYLLHFGFVDQAGHDEIQANALEIQQAVNDGRFQLATELWEKTELVMIRVTQDVDFYNVLLKISPIWKPQRKIIIHPSFFRDLVDNKINFLMNNNVSRALALNVTWGDQQSAVFHTLREDFMKPVTDIVELLLNTTDVKVAVYNGQLDLIVDTPGTVKWVDKLKFEGAETWATASRTTIVADDVIEGYCKKVGNLAMYWVNRAGHMVPADNPAAMELILKEMTDGYKKKKNNVT